MSGRDLKRAQQELGVTPEEVCNEAGISITSLYKVFNGEHVRASTIAKVRNAIARMKARLSAEANTAAG